MAQIKNIENIAKKYKSNIKNSNIEKKREDVVHVLFR